MVSNVRMGRLELAWDGMDDVERARSRIPEPGTPVSASSARALE
jgi:hypothetical protein